MGETIKDLIEIQRTELSNFADSSALSFSIFCLYENILRFGVILIMKFALFSAIYYNKITLKSE